MSISPLQLPLHGLQIDRSILRIGICTAHPLNPPVQGMIVGAYVAPPPFHEYPVRISGVFANPMEFFGITPFHSQVLLWQPTTNTRDQPAKPSYTRGLWIDASE